MSILMIACSSKDNPYAIRDKEIEEKLGGMDDKTADILGKILQANNKDALYYETYDSTGELLSKDLQKEWEDRKISYRKNFYDREITIEEVILFDKDKCTYINIQKEKFCNRDGLKTEDAKAYQACKYKDPSLLYEALANKGLDGIDYEGEDIRVKFSDGTYAIYDKNYDLIEKTDKSEACDILIKLVERKADPDALFDEYKDMTKKMNQVDSLDQLK